MENIEENSHQRIIACQEALKTNLDLVRITEDDQAISVLQQIAFGAKKELYIVDPYVRTYENIKELIENTDGAKTLKIFLDTAENRSDFNDIKSDIEKEFKRSKQVTTFSIDEVEIIDMRRLLKPNHDRFIVTESRCWCIGTSLNRLGSKHYSFIIDIDYPGAAHLYSSLNDVKKSDVVRHCFRSIAESSKVHKKTIRLNHF